MDGKIKVTLLKNGEDSNTNLTKQFDKVEQTLKIDNMDDSNIGFDDIKDEIGDSEQDGGSLGETLKIDNMDDSNIGFDDIKDEIGDSEQDGGSLGETLKIDNMDEINIGFDDIKDEIGDSEQDGGSLGETLKIDDMDEINIGFDDIKDEIGDSEQDGGSLGETLKIDDIDEQLSKNKENNMNFLQVDKEVISDSDSEPDDQMHTFKLDDISEQINLENNGGDNDEIGDINEQDISSENINFINLINKSQKGGAQDTVINNTEYEEYLFEYDLFLKETKKETSYKI